MTAAPKDRVVTSKLLCYFVHKTSALTTRAKSTFAKLEEYLMWPLNALLSPCVGECAHVVSEQAALTPCEHTLCCIAALL